jgi:hypothetical protein
MSRLAHSPVAACSDWDSLLALFASPTRRRRARGRAETQAASGNDESTAAIQPACTAHACLEEFRHVRIAVGIAHRNEILRHVAAGGQVSGSMTCCWYAGRSVRRRYQASTLRSAGRSTLSANQR